MKKVAFAGAALSLAALAVFLWPRDEAAPVAAALAATPPSARITDATLGDQDPELPGDGDRSRVVRASPDVALDPAVFRGGLRGRLVGPAGEPLAHAVVHAYGFDGPALFVGGGGLARADARTDAAGRFELDGLPTRARCALVADADGELRQLVPLAATVEPGRRVDLGDVALESRAVVTGTVVGPDGAPRAGVEVFAADVPALIFAALPVDRFVPDNGALLVLPRPTPEDRTSDGRDYWQRLRAHLAWALIRDRFALDDPELVATVLDGAPLRELWDMLPIARTTTAADGTFRLAGVATGNNVLAARAPGFATAVRSGLRMSSRRPRDVGTLRLATGESVGGRVVDAHGEPVAGADVRAAAVAAIGFRGVAPCEPPVRSQGDGTFRFDGLPRGDVCVAARRGPGEPWVAVGPVETGVVVDVVLPDRSPLRLVVRTPDGIDPSAVRVRARPVPPLGELARLGMAEGLRDVGVASVDEGGLDLEPIAHGVWTLRVDAPGCTPIVRLVEIPVDREVAIALPAAVQVDVHVVIQDGRPCAGAEVFVVDRADAESRRVLIGDYGLPQWPESVPRAPVRTPASGKIRIDAPGTDPVLVARHPLHGAAMLQLDDGRGEEVQLRLRPAGSLEGRVRVHGDAGAGPRAFRVFVSPSGIRDGDPSPSVDVGAWPDVDGRFRVDGLPADNYDVELRSALPASLTISSLVPFLQDKSRGLFSDPGTIATQTVDVEAGEVARVEFEPGAPRAQVGVVRGTATYGGKPAEGFTVWLRDREEHDGFTYDGGWEGRPSAVLDAGGSFVVEGVRARRSWLGLRDGGGGAFVHVWRVDVEAGVTAVVAANVRVGELRGVVRRPDGGPATRVPVWVGGRGTSEFLAFRAETDPSGRFVVRDVPVGSYSASVGARHLEVEAHDVDVLPGTSTPPLELVGQARYVLELRVADAPTVENEAFFRVDLRNERTDHSNSYGGTARLVEFTLEEPGTYRVHLWCQGRYYEAVPPTVEVVEPDTAIEVQPGKQVESIR